MGPLVGVNPLFGDRGLGRAAAVGIVVTVDRDLAAIEATCPDNRIGRLHVEEFAVTAVGRRTRQDADLPPAFRIDEPFDALTNRGVFPDCADDSTPSSPPSL